MLDRGMVEASFKIFDRLTKVYKNKDELIELSNELYLRSLKENKMELAIKYLKFKKNY